MPLSPATDVGGWTSAASYGTGSYATGSFTPPANALLLIFVGRITDGGSGNPGALSSISGGSLSYTAITDAHNTPAWSHRQDAYLAVTGGSPGPMTITVDDANNIYQWTIRVIAYTGFDTDTPVAGAVSSGATNIGDGAETQTLGATPTADDVTLLSIHVDAESDTPSPVLTSGWTQVHNAGFMAVARRESSTSTSVTVTDVYNGGGTFGTANMLSFIVKAAAGGGASAFPWHHYARQRAAK